MDNEFRFVYIYQFKNGTTKHFDLRLNAANLLLTTKKQENLPLWALLPFHKCAICPLSEKDHIYCPICANLAGIVEQFKNFLSHERVSVTVVCEERFYGKETTVQGGLSPLLGIIMTTSGCPIMEQLKPMVRFHLPFASLDETIYRGVTMFLTAQYFRHQDGKTAAWSIDGLGSIYSEVGQVNRDFANRMRAAAKKDANVNALVNLDVFASMMTLAAEDTLKRLKPYFSALLEKG
ncbi:MAG: hypothetical protein HGB21_00350 [Nitrospirae bacterium]|nr:hypothetical protein [Nitrospirota bacterium]NTW64750.1 hypothetical protein [Nitrospirota bacterium]